jgi:hypothetical protein
MMMGFTSNVCPLVDLRMNGVVSMREMDRTGQPGSRLGPLGLRRDPESHLGRHNILSTNNKKSRFVLTKTHYAQC